MIKRYISQSAASMLQVHKNNKLSMKPPLINEIKSDPYFSKHYKNIYKIGQGYVKYWRMGSVVCTKRCFELFSKML